MSNKGNNYRLVFVDGKKKSIYSLNIQEQQDKDPRVSLKIVMRDGDVKEINDYDGIMNIFGAKGIELNGIDGLLEGLGNIDREKFGRDMEKWGEEFGRKMEKYGEKMEKFGKKVEENKKRIEKKNNNA